MSFASKSRFAIRKVTPKGNIAYLTIDDRFARLDPCATACYDIKSFAEASADWYQKIHKKSTIEVVTLQLVRP